MVGVADVDAAIGGIVDNVDIETMGCVADDGGIVDDDEIPGKESTGCVGDVDASNGGIGKGVDRVTMGCDADDGVLVEDVVFTGTETMVGVGDVDAANGGIEDDDASSAGTKKKGSCDE